MAEQHKLIESMFHVHKYDPETNTITNCVTGEVKDRVDKIYPKDDMTIKRLPKDPSCLPMPDDRTGLKDIIKILPKPYKPEEHGTLPVPKPWH